MTQIQLGPFVYQVAERFTEGQALTLGEAQALNALRAENLRNNLARWVERQASPVSSEDAQAKLAEMDLAYQFNPRRPVPAKRGTLDEEISRVEEEMRAARVRQLGGLYGEIVVDREIVEKEALRRIEARKAVAEEALADLFGGK